MDEHQPPDRDQAAAEPPAPAKPGQDQLSEPHRCPQCRESVQSGALKCPHCLSIIPPTGPSHGGTCPYCREAIHRQASRCPHCQSDLMPPILLGSVFVPEAAEPARSNPCTHCRSAATPPPLMAAQAWIPGMPPGIAVPGLPAEALAVPQTIGPGPGKWCFTMLIWRCRPTTGCSYRPETVCPGGRDPGVFG